MKLSIGIVGLPNVGKSTLFKLLTKNEVDCQNYPFCTIDPNVGVVEVRDERLERLAQLSQSVKKIPAVVEFYDIAGLVKGANEGAGLGNKFLSHIRNTNAILMVLRVFEGRGIIHVENSVDPVRDLDTINAELMLKDLETVQKRLGSLEKDIKAGNKEAVKERDLLELIKNSLNESKLITEWRDEPAVANLQLLSAKKQIYLLNGSEADVSQALKERLRSLGADYIIIDLNEEVNRDSGGVEFQISELIKLAYKTLGLISFFTTGPEETRAWTIKAGSKAPEAAGAIHSDFEKKFIRAEVVSYEKLVEAGNWNNAKSKGWLRVEGKDYVVKDGDVLVVRHG